MSSLDTLDSMGFRTLNRVYLHPEDKRCCNECHTIYQGIADNFHIKKYYENGAVGYNVKCKYCLNKVNKQRTSLYRQDPAQFIKAKITGFKCRAKELDVAFDLTVEELVQQWDQQAGICFYSGMPIAFDNISEAGKAPHRMMASLDRMDPAQGYIVGNVVWCSYVMNRMKNDLTYDEFINMCNHVINVRKQYD